MMQKRTLYSLLLTFMILVCAFSFSMAQNSVTFQNKSAKRCETGVLNVSVTNAATISAVEIVFEVKSGSSGAWFDAMTFQWDAGFTVLTDRVVDTSGVDHVDPDTVRVAAMMTASGDQCLAAGTKTVAKVQFKTNDTCSGTIELDGAVFTCHTPCSCLVTAQTQFVDCSTTTLVPAAVNKGTVTIQNVAPSLDPIAKDSLPWGTWYYDTAYAHDLDLLNGCEDLTFSKCGGPNDLQVTKISDTTAQLKWFTTGADVCDHTVCIKVTDDCGAVDSTTFIICVYDLPPEFVDCPTDTTRIIWGDTARGDVDATDPDDGPANLNYSVLNFDGPGAVSIIDSTGEWKWPTDFTNDYIGIFKLCILVSDGAPICPSCNPTNADTCCVYISVIPKIHVYIEKTDNTLLGQFEDVSIHLNPGIDPPNYMGGFDFLISYDASVLTFQYAEPGMLLDSCNWEYFTYRFGQFGNCAGGPCPSGILRVVAMAETNNGPYHPTCFTSTVWTELVKLRFYVTSNLLYECTYIPIKFIWYDCGDNTISSKDGDTLFISQHVYGYVGPEIPPQDSNVVPGIYGWYNNITYDTTFPTFFGAPDECLVGGGPNKPKPLRLVNFFNGGIDVYCVDTLDDRGDINLNGVKNEVADAVMFTNYFIYGLNVFKINQLAQIAATDVNADGLTLSVADLVYLVRIITGDASPYPKVVTSVQATYVHGSDGIMRVSNDVTMGAAFVVVRGDVTPELLAPDMEMKYAFDGEQTRILVYSLEGHGFTGEFLHVNGEVVSVEMATYEGNPVVAKLIPAEFALHQNYPNPFNPTTTISFSLPIAADYTLTIYNVSGQQVEQFVGSHEAGVVEIAWEAGDLASGVYFYKLVAGSFSDTKKMVLLK
jgi:hypothetical protein